MQVAIWVFQVIVGLSLYLISSVSPSTAVFGSFALFEALQFEKVSIFLICLLLFSSPIALWQANLLLIFISCFLVEFVDGFDLELFFVDLAEDAVAVILPQIYDVCELFLDCGQFQLFWVARGGQAKVLVSFDH